MNPVSPAASPAPPIVSPSATPTPAADGTSPAATVDTVSLEDASRQLFGSTNPSLGELQAYTRATLLEQPRNSEVSGANRRSLHDAGVGLTYVGKIGPTRADARYEKKYLTALDEQGNEKWTFTQASMTSDPVLDLEGRICFRSRDRLQARHPPLSRHDTSDHPQLRAWGDVVVVLSR